MQATASAAISFIFASSKAADEFRRCGFKLTKADYAVADDALAHAKAKYVAKPLDERNDFEHNLAVAAESETIRIKDSGITAYILGGMLRDRDGAFKREQEKLAFSSEYLGVVGDKFMVQGRCVDCREIDGGYGISFKLTFIDSENRKVVWFSSNSPASLGLAVQRNDDGAYTRADLIDKVVTIVGKVKKHGDWQGVNETAVSHCKIDDETAIKNFNKKPKAKRT